MGNTPVASAESRSAVRKLPKSSCPSRFAEYSIIACGMRESVSGELSREILNITIIFGAQGTRNEIRLGNVHAGRMGALSGAGIGRWGRAARALRIGARDSVELGPQLRG